MTALIGGKLVAENIVGTKGVARGIAIARQDLCRQAAAAKQFPFRGKVFKARGLRRHVDVK